MSLDFDKIKQSENRGADNNIWSSYSDLFMVLSLVFLLLYVVSSLRTSTHTIKNQLEYQRLEQQAGDLSAQNQVYNTLKDSYLETQASQQEQKVYEQLMKQLTLLKDEAREEKERLRQEAQDNEQKEMALNTYQQIVRNIINANVLAKAGLEQRDKVIASKSQQIQEQIEKIRQRDRKIAEKVETIRQKESEIKEQENEIASKKQTIEENRQIIKQKLEQINQLNRSIDTKEQQLAANDQQISQISNQLETKLAELKHQAQENEISKQNYESQVKRLTEQSNQQIQELEESNQQVSKQLKSVNSDLQQANAKLTSVSQELNQQTKVKQALSDKLSKARQDLTKASKSFEQRADRLKHQFKEQMEEERAAFDKKMKGLELSMAERRAQEAAFKASALEKEQQLHQEISDLASQITATQDQVRKERGQASRLANELAETKQKFGKEKQAMLDEFDQKMAGEEQKFRDALTKEKLSGAEKAAKEKAHRDAAVAKTKALLDKVAQLDGRLQESKAKLSNAEKSKADYEKFIGDLKSKNQALSDDLKRSMDTLKAKKQIVEQIKDNFKKEGIDAKIDPGSGDMILTFGEHYFETGKSVLKDGMKDTLREMVPVYARSLFENGEVAENIASVEIIGFSSPTYRGKFVDPQSLDARDRDAVHFNLDLSYRRAKSIFKYIFDTKQMSFDTQQKLLRMIKVTGRSFLAESVKGRDLKRGLSQDELCKKYDCKQSQRVIIKFNIKD